MHSSELTFGVRRTALTCEAPSSQLARAARLLPRRSSAVDFSAILRPEQARVGTAKARQRSHDSVFVPLRISDEIRYAPSEQSRQIAGEPAQLFDLQHVRAVDPFFLLYFPIGTTLAVIRITLWVILLLVDQPWLTDNSASIAALQMILGIKVEWQNAELIPDERHVLVSNHVTTGDLIALYQRPRRIVHLISTALPKRVAQAKHHRVDLRHACLETYDKLSEDGEEDSIHLFPEGGMTNGTGMMKFSRGFLRFAHGLPVVPVALRASLPWSISTHTLNSSFLSNLFWFCFSPYVSLQLTVLPAMTQQKGEGKGNFVQRVQEEIAEELQIPILDFTIQAKKKLMQTAFKAKR